MKSEVKGEVKAEGGMKNEGAVKREVKNDPDKINN